jgi:hypothetical protein
MPSSNPYRVRPPLQPFGWRVGRYVSLGIRWRLRRDSLGAKLRRYVRKKRGTLRSCRFRDSTWRVRRDSLGAKLRRYARKKRGRYALGDLGIRHGVYAASPLLQRNFGTSRSPRANPQFRRRNFSRAHYRIFGAVPTALRALKQTFGGGNHVNHIDMAAQSLAVIAPE